MIPTQLNKTGKEEIRNKNLDVNSDQKSQPGQRKKVWAGPLDLDEKISDDEILHYIDELMKLGRIWEAGELADKLPEEVRETERVRFLLEERRLINTRVRELESLDGWTMQVDGKSRNSQGLSIYYRYTSGSPIIEVKAMFRLEANIANACCIANEIDFWPMFLSNLLKVETKDCARYGFTTMVPWVKVHLPWPMSHRECFLGLRVYDLITEKNMCFIFGEDLTESTKYLDFKIPSLENGSIRVKAKMMAMGKPVSWDVTDMIAMFTVDPVVPFPQRIVNWLTRTVAWRIFTEFRKACENLPKEHLERKEADVSGLYKYVEERMKIVFTDLPKTARG